jgi:hypothetical protein
MTEKTERGKVKQLVVDLACSPALSGEGVLDASSKRAVWEEFAAGHGGRFRVTTTRNQTYARLICSLPHAGSEVVFLEDDAKPLKLSYAIPRDDGFRFSLWPQDAMDAVAHFFGAQDIEVGDAEFDKAFVIKATSAPRVCHLLASARLRGLLLDKRFPFLGLDELDGPPSLRMTASRTIETQAELEALHAFFCEVIARLGV